MLRGLSPARTTGLALGMILILVGLLLLPLGTRSVRGDGSVKVAIVVGPVGSEITPIYLELAELAAASAEERGATVTRAYSPNATPDRVIEAVDGADIVVYFGHGTGFPNPYSSTLNPARVNGWGLQGPSARGTHDDSLADGTLEYHGEAWLEASLRPAPGFVMIYSNACYAPGASEGGQPRPTEAEALAHVANYSRPVLAMGASAYFATDFSGGAAEIIARLLDGPSTPYGDIFRQQAQFDASRLRTFAHPSIDGAEVWLHRSPYFDGAEDYWYAFAGSASLSFRPTVLASADEPMSPSDEPIAATPTLLASGRASSYPSQPGYGEALTAALPVELGGVALTETGLVAVCADRCVIVQVVDSCGCYWGSGDQRVINLSHSAWHAVTDYPLAEGLVDVRVYRDGAIPDGEAPRVLYPDVDLDAQA